METSTTETVERTLILGGDPDAPFPVPALIFGDFRDAPELKRIGDALIAACDELEDLRWAIEEDDFTIAYVWKKKASKSADKFVAGKNHKSSGMTSHFAKEAKGQRVGYVVALAADANYGQTNYQIEARVFHELYHCKIGRKTVGKGEDKQTVPVLKVRGHDLEMFWAERQRYGDWHSALEKGREVFAQTRLPIERKDSVKKARKNRSAANGHGPLSDDPEMVADLLGHAGASAGKAANGAHDDSPLLDPDRVCQTLAERGWQIAYTYRAGEPDGRYTHPITGEVYGTQTVEAEYRAALSGRAG